MRRREKRSVARASLLLLLTLAPACVPSLHAASTCRKVVLEGAVNSGKSWQAAIGNGWVFRVLPIQPKGKYSGWDLVVDRTEGAGFPDALFLATPPYSSINEREIGTTYGLRAQDAIGWNPRTFNFILHPDAFRQAQILFRRLEASGAFSKGVPADQQDATDMSHLIDLQKHAAAGELRIDDARIVPGTGNAAPYAQAWSQASALTPHQVEAAGTASGTAAGSLNWMKFTITLWLPEKWSLPQGVAATKAPCR